MKQVIKRRYFILSALFAGVGLWLGHFFKKGGIMKSVIHRANSRGLANHGWLLSKHSFSFGGYRNPERMGFGLLRVINDDRVAPESGFGTHPHQDMEIISVPLKGALRHKDSEGNEAVIRHGEVQLMSAGTGVFHSEYNHSDTEEVQFLQIWVLPEKKRIKPRYDQKKFDTQARRNQFQRIVSPIGTKDESVKINQQAYFSLIDLESDKQAAYSVQQAKHGVYVFVLEGEVEVENATLYDRDGMGIEDVNRIQMVAKKDAKLLLIEVPMA